MATRKLRLAVAAMVLSIGGLAGQSANATTTYTGSYVFGDSLSDRGNAAESLGYNFPNPPSYHDSLTNGDVAVQVMAQRLGFNADPSLWVTGFSDANKLGLTTGPNYAVAGATASALGSKGNDLTNQITYYLGKSSGVADPNALYTVFIGGNDVRNAVSTGNEALVTAGVNSELTGISRLYAAGARNFLIVNVPDVSLIPEFNKGSAADVARARQYSLEYDNGLAAGVALLSANPAGSFKLFDLYSFENSLSANAAALGFTNTTDACYTSVSVTNRATFTAATSDACGPIDSNTHQATNIDSFFYWDNIHPTARVHALLGNALADYVAAVPEPSSWAMMILGIGLAGATLRSRRRPSLPAAA